MVYTIYYEELKGVILLENLDVLKDWIQTHGWVYFPSIHELLSVIKNKEVIDYLQKLISYSTG